MSQRLTMNWLLYLLALYAGSLWSPAQSVAVRAPPNNPATVEAQAKFFQDFFSVQLSPYKIEFGHVCEDPNNWEQRYEKKDFKNHRDMGKVRWGDKKGGYGEHYWDLNHAGHANDHGDNSYDNDDGSYHEENDPYDEPSDHSPTYGNEEYDPEKSSYEEASRNKRAYPKVKVVRKAEEDFVVAEQPKSQPNRDTFETPATHKVEAHEKQKPSGIGLQQDEKRHQYQIPDEETKKKQQLVLIVNHKDRDAEEQAPRYARRPEVKGRHFVPYESGAGVRQHQEEEATVLASVPRLFLEPSTGHVVDRATGQAYMLQPIRYN